MLIDRIKKSWNQNCSFIHKDTEKKTLDVFTEYKVGMYREKNVEYMKKILHKIVRK